MRSLALHSATRLVAAWLFAASAAIASPRALHAQTPPRDTSTLRRDSTGHLLPPRPAADTDTTKHDGTISLGGLPAQVNLRIEAKAERDLNLRCNSVDALQLGAVSGCRAPFIWPNLQVAGSVKTAGVIAERFHLNVDYDMEREFESSNTLSFYYQGPAASKLQRVDVGNIDFAPPASRFITSSLPRGNYGLQVTNQFGALRVRTIFAKQTGNVAQTRKFTLAARTQQRNERDVDDFQVERLRFFFTINPSLFGSAYPNIDLLNRTQLAGLRAALPDSVRPTRVLLYRLQFGTQPQNPNGPRFRLNGDLGGGRQTYDLLREGVDYYMDPSQLWFALVRPLNAANERLVAAFYVRVNGRDTVLASTGGTPDLERTTAHDQVANLIMDPSVGPSSPQFRNEIRSVYRVAGEDLVRRTLTARVVTGSGQLEHPVAGTDPTFLTMLGLAQRTNPAELDYENRLWPRENDVFNLGAGAADVRNGQSLDAAKIIRDYFLMPPSVQPFSARPNGLVAPGNPTNDAIYTIPGPYLSSTQHPASIYRLHLRYETAGTDESGVITLGATQMRPGSERVALDGRPLVRDLDYRVDYDLARIELLRADTLLTRERTIEVGYEENQQFAASPTTLAGVVSELPLPHGVLNFTAINQSQTNAFTRPQLGFQGNSMLTAGVSGDFHWDAPALTHLAKLLPFSGATTAASHLALQAELASSRPQFASRQGDAFVETFDAGAGISIALSDLSWYYSSLPAYGTALRSQLGGSLLEPDRAASLVWQTNVSSPGGRPITFTQTSIDPLTHLVGSGFEFNQPVLWLTLLPLDQAGRYDRAAHRYDWTVAGAPAGRRFRSIRTVLNPSGIDLTGGELLQFWTLLDTSITARASNPTLVFDFGDVSENSLAFAPETLTVRRNADGTVDSLFTGKKLQGFDSLYTERDPFSHAFDAQVNDTGLPGDVVDTIVVIDGTSVIRVPRFRLCRATPGTIDALGDPHTDCTIGNNKLDEEDIDQDNALNFRSSQRESERLLRYVVDLSDTAKYRRIGASFTDTLFVEGVPQVRTRRWVLISVPFKTPTDSLNDVDRRRLRALRVTMISPAAGLLGDEVPIQLPIAELTVTGAPWLDRSSQSLAGIAGIRPDGGFVITSTIGTTDSSAAVVYQPPPGVGDEADTRNAQFQGTLTQINESSLRIQTGALAVDRRAEAFFRFPTGLQDFRGFDQLRVWARGRGNGWGPSGDLQMYIKVGRDENNFYMYHAPAVAGATRAAWTDFPVDFSRFNALRSQVEQAYLSGKTESIACTGVDSAIVVASPLPPGVVAHRFAACSDGYMVYTIDPAVTAPNLAAVQELAVGIVRVGATAGGTAILPGDTLELWVDDIRLSQPRNTAGYAGSLAMSGNIADLADFRMSVSNRDPNFRQLGEQQTFMGQRTVDFASTVRLDKLLPRALGLALPLTITKVSLGEDPLYLAQSDIRGSAIAGLRKPKNDLTTYSLTVRHTAPLGDGLLGAVVNNLSATSSYVTGVDRTEFQDGNAHNFNLSLDYLLASDSARTLTLPSWLDGALGSLPGVMQAGPVNALRSGSFRWNPSQLRFTSGVVRASDRRLSFITPSGATDEQPSLTTAESRLWRNASVLELRPTNDFTVRWQVESARDLRDYGDTSAFAAAASGLRRNVFGMNAGFERERALITTLSWSPLFSSWLRPRTDVGAQYDMLRDPDLAATLASTSGTLPGVVGVDSVLAARDSAALLGAIGLPRRMTAAQTASAGATLDIAGAFKAYTRDSSALRRVGSLFAPIDLSYTRSLLSTLDASPADAPLPLQFGLGGPGSFRRVGGVDATTAGQTGTLAASGSLLLPFGTSVINRFRRTTTVNWIARPAPDSSQAQVNGEQTSFPDVSLRWGLHPAAGQPVISMLNADVGYTRTLATVSLPSLFGDAPPDIRRTHVESFPIGGSIDWALRGGLSTGARYAFTRRIDSLPGSVARSRGNELNLDAGRAFRLPGALADALGVRDAVRARAGYQSNRTTTFVFGDGTTVGSRLQDNGRQAFNLTADTNLNENLVFTVQGSHVVTFDNNLSHRFAQTIFSTVLQVNFFGR
ncbi:MAG TPA: cell surface protein SprA [Gemmatimonadaceae bacterium]|nr:cell surface protein SprA [Gemmatimonadaceae bacterium]